MNNIIESKLPKKKEQPKLSKEEIFKQQQKRFYHAFVHGNNPQKAQQLLSCGMYYENWPSLVQDMMKEHVAGFDVINFLHEHLSKKVFDEAHANLVFVMCAIQHNRVAYVVNYYNTPLGEYFESLYKMMLNQHKNKNIADYMMKREKYLLKNQ